MYFVERFDPEQAVADASKLTSVKGDLVLFPEGTFQTRAGLMPFHMGAFLTAIDRQATVIPVAIEGTRQILAGGTWMPVRGDIRVTTGTALLAEATDESNRWHDAIGLREQARQWILAHCKEPDLS